MTSGKHVLIVDDDREIRCLLSRFLEESGFKVSTAASGRSMRVAIDRARVDLIVLDLMLPGEDGLALFRFLRTRTDAAVVMLTAKSSQVDRIVGLEIGADDYVTKPFDPRELVARLRNVLRRTDSPRTDLADSAAVIGFAGWHLDMTARELTDPQGRRVLLSGAEFRVLAILLSSENRVISRAELIEITRGRSAEPFDRSVDVRVSRLRQILGDDAKVPKIIKTVYGEGYVIGVPVRRA